MGGSVLTILEKVWSNSEDYSGEKCGLGFIFLYELLTGQVCLLHISVYIQSMFSVKCFALTLTFHHYCTPKSCTPGAAAVQGDLRGVSARRGVGEAAAGHDERRPSLRRVALAVVQGSAFEVGPGLRD